MRIYYYVSLAFFNHKVLKCAGFGAENLDHRKFYLPHFREQGANDQKASQGPFTVVLAPFLGDKIDAPRFQHDCESCLYLGQHDKADLYFCGDQIVGSRCTVIARYSSDGPDYQSGWECGKGGHIPDLAEAYKRATAFGLGEVLRT